jgi:hypothetical protein
MSGRGVVPIVVYTDHNPLTYLRSMMFPNQRIMRWCLFLQSFHLDVRHIRGTENVIADALSCALFLNVYVTDHCSYCHVLSVLSAPSCFFFFPLKCCFLCKGCWGLGRRLAGANCKWTRNPSSIWDAEAVWSWDAEGCVVVLGPLLVPGFMGGNVTTLPLCLQYSLCCFLIRMPVGGVGWVVSYMGNTWARCLPG